MATVKKSLVTKKESPAAREPSPTSQQKLLLALSPGISLLTKFMPRIKLTKLEAVGTTAFVNHFIWNSGKLCFSSSRSMAKGLNYGFVAKVLRDFFSKQMFVIFIN